MKALIVKYQKFYNWWIHPEIKANPKADEITWESIMSTFMSLGFYFIMYFVYSYVNYTYGEYAVYVGIFQSVLLLILFRYSKNVKAISIVTTALFFIVIFLISLGDGGIWSLYHTGYIIMMLWMFKYGPKVGLTFLFCVFLWFATWSYIEHSGLVRIEPLSESVAYIQRICFIIIMLVGFAIHFFYSNKNEYRIRQKLTQIQSRAASQDKLASIGRLSSGIAHEINNPLNFIKNNAEALKLNYQDIKPLLTALEQSPSNSSEITGEKLLKLGEKINLSLIQTETKELIDGIISGTKRVESIIKSMHYVSHTDLEKEMVLTDIHEPIRSAIMILQPKLKSELQVKTHFAALKPIKINPGQISQVVINILNNSMQAIKGKGTISVETSKVENRCFIRFSDDGEGMDKETKSKIFDQFFTTKEVGQGTGLGMSISYSIIKAHGGEIQAESTVGKGTTIEISLPYD